MESSVCYNFEFGFSSTKSDVVIHLSQWQYWWWFWFSLFWTLYFFITIKLINKRIIQFNPVLNTSLRSHAKWGDFLISIIPLSWCGNILINSNFILRMIEFQNESSLFTIRVQGKQWYWVYKYNIETTMSTLCVPKSVGRGHWMIHKPGHVYVTDSYQEAVSICTKLEFYEKYKEDVNRFKKKPLKFFFDLDIPYIKNLIKTNHLNSNITNNSSNLNYKVYDKIKLNILKKNINKENIFIEQIISSLKNYTQRINLKIQSNLTFKKNNNLYILFKLKKETKFKINLIKAHLKNKPIKLQNINKNLIYKSINLYKFIDFFKKKKEIKLNKLLLTLSLLDLNKKNKNIILLNKLLGSIIKERYFNFYTFFKKLSIDNNFSNIKYLYINKFLKNFKSIYKPNSNFFTLKSLIKECNIKLTKFRMNIYYYNKIKNFNYIPHTKENIKKSKILDFNKILLNLQKNIISLNYHTNKGYFKNKYNEYIWNLYYINSLDRVNRAILSNIIKVKIDISSKIFNYKKYKNNIFYSTSKYKILLLRIFTLSGIQKKKYFNLSSIDTLYQDCENWRIKKIINKDISNLILLNIFGKGNIEHRNNVINYLKEFVKDTITYYFKYKIQKVYNNNLKKKRFLINIVNQSGGSYEKFLYLKYSYKVSTNLVFSKKKYFWINLENARLNYFFTKVLNRLKNTNTNIYYNKFSPRFLFLKKNLLKSKIYQAQHNFIKITFFNDNARIVIHNKTINSLFCKVLRKSTNKNALYNAFALSERYIKCTYCVLLQLNKDLKLIDNSIKSIENINKLISMVNVIIKKQFFQFFLLYKQDLQNINTFNLLQLSKKYKLYNNNLQLLNLLDIWNLKKKRQQIHFNINFLLQLSTLIKNYNAFKKKIFFFDKLILVAQKSKEIAKESYDLNYKIVKRNPIKVFNFSILKKIGFTYNKQIELLGCLIKSADKFNQLVKQDKNINNLGLLKRKDYFNYDLNISFFYYPTIDFLKNLKYSDKFITNNKNFLLELFNSNLFLKKKNLNICIYRTKFLIFNLKNFILNNSNKQSNIQYKSYLNIIKNKQQEVMQKSEYKLLNKFFQNKSTAKPISVYILKKNNILSYRQKLKVVKLKILNIVNILNNEQDKIKKIKFIKYVQFLIKLTGVKAIEQYIRDNKASQKNLRITFALKSKVNKIYSSIPKKYINVKKDIILKLINFYMNSNKKYIKNFDNIEPNYKINFIMSKFYIRYKLQKLLTQDTILKLKAFNLINEKKKKNLKKFLFKDYTSINFLSKQFDLPINLKLINSLKIPNNKLIKNLLQINKVLNLFDILSTLKSKKTIINIIKICGPTLSKINSTIYPQINLKPSIKSNYGYTYIQKKLYPNQLIFINMLYPKDYLNLLKPFKLKKFILHPTVSPRLNIFVIKKINNICINIEQTKTYILKKQLNLLLCNQFKIYLFKDLSKNNFAISNIIKFTNINFLKKNFFFNNNFKNLNKLNSYQEILLKLNKTVSLNKILKLFTVKYNWNAKSFISNKIFIKNEISELSDIFRQKFNGKFINSYINTIYKLNFNKVSSHSDYSALDENDDFSCNMREIELSKPSRLISGVLNKHNLELLKKKNCKKLILFKYKFQDSNSSLTDKIATQEIIRGFRQKRKRRLGYEHFLFKPKLIFDSITFEPIGFKNKQLPIKEIKHYPYIDDINLDNPEYFTEIEKINPKLVASKKPILTKLKPNEIQKPVVREPYDIYSSVRLNKKHSEIIPVTLAKRLLRTRRTLVLPVHVNLTLITNSYDVVHSWFIPGLGLKMDCVPGRSTHHSLYIDSVGFYYGQCAEICGRYHHHMPIRVCALPFEHFMLWWKTRGIKRMHRWENSQILKNNGKNLTALRKKKNIINQLI